MKKTISTLILLILMGCSFENPTTFSEQSLTEKVVTIDGNEVTMKEVLNDHKGKKVVIDIWASWCKDCVVGFPNLKKFQEENPEVVYLFLSLDKSVKSWKKGIKRFDLQGGHYFMKEGDKGAFGEFLNLWWIPRYVVVNEVGEITLFKAVKITDKNIVQALKK
jgi:thiol-disulfide isomerase/thioredoxin